MDDPSFASNFDAIVYDYDGTLTDTADVKADAWLHAAVATWPEYPVWSAYFQTLPQVFAGVSREAILYRACAAAPPIRTGYGAFQVPVVDELLRLIKNYITESMPTSMRGVESHLERDLGLNDMLRFIVSGAPQDEVQAGISALGFDDYFEAVWGNEDPNLTKFDRLVQLIEQHKLTPSRVLYIGDTSQDMLAARDAGMVGMLLGTTHLGKPELERLTFNEDYYHAANWDHMLTLYGI